MENAVYWSAKSVKGLLDVPMSVKLVDISGVWEYAYETEAMAGPVVA